MRAFKSYLQIYDKISPNVYFFLPLENFLYVFESTLMLKGIVSSIRLYFLDPNSKYLKMCLKYHTVCLFYGIKTILFPLF